MRLIWNHEIAIARAIHAERRDQGNRGIGFLVAGALGGALIWVSLLALATHVVAVWVG